VINNVYDKKSYQKGAEMSKHDPEKKHSSIETKHPSKVKIRNELNADVLFKTIRSEFDRIPEFRNGEPDISIADALMSGFAMFSLKDSSLLRFDNRRNEPTEIENLKKVYGINVVPCDSRMREINDEIDPMKYISPAFKKVFGKLQRGKALEPLVFYEGCYLLNLDGTEFFSSKKNHAPFCMEKKSKKSGEITYYLQMLGAAIVHPDFREVIPLCPEMIIRKDGESKNDCERNASKRFFEKLRKDHPHLKLIINEDSLSANAPHIRDLERYDLNYIIGVKPGDHEFLFNEVMTAVDENRTIEFIHIDKEHPDISHQYRILNQVSLNKSNQELRVNFLEYWEKSEKSEKPNKITYHNSWITSFTLSEDNAYTIMRGGRARWKIENETFNTLKNQGYNFEHNYGLGKKNLAVVFIMLMMLAFLVDQTQQLCCSLFKSVWKTLGSKK
jgi:hypothetical protein